MFQYACAFFENVPQGKKYAETLKSPYRLNTHAHFFENVPQGKKYGETLKSPYRLNTHAHF